jgi:hypothetical protein
MPQSNSYKRFISQFSLPEWKRLCKHRLFLHFLKIDLKIAASLAADALQRPIQHSFPDQAPQPKQIKGRKEPSEDRSASGFRHRRFRL